MHVLMNFSPFTSVNKCLDFSLVSWISENDILQNVDPLPQWAVLQLMQMWGITRFISDQKCSNVQHATGNYYLMNLILILF